MNRRDLLKYLLMTPAATFVDYEKLLWVPGEKKIFIPEPIISNELIFESGAKIIFMSSPVGNHYEWIKRMYRDHPDRLARALDNKGVLFQFGN